MNKEKKRNYIIWVLVIILLVCVMFSVYLLINSISGFLHNDVDAIPITPDISQDEGQGDGDGSSAGDHETTYTYGLEASHSGIVWTSDTKLEIFRVTYTDDQKNPVVVSQGSDKVIAPGTDNSFMFKLKNTGNHALDYDLVVETAFSLDGASLPVNGNVLRHDGKCVAGNAENTQPILDIHSKVDSGVLSGGRYTYYTLNWQWPFEGESDEYDTLLGNLAAQGEELILYVNIKTVATASDDPNASGGMLSPQTGDGFNMVLWAVVAALSLSLMIYLMFFAGKTRDDDKRSDSPAE